MIEPTDEMLAAFLAAWDNENRIINESDGEYVEVGARDRAGLAAALALVERDYLRVMADLVDTEPCWFDHHGGCQAHSFLSLEPGEKCPHAAAKELLGLESTS